MLKVKIVMVNSPKTKTIAFKRFIFALVSRKRNRILCRLFQSLLENEMRDLRKESRSVILDVPIQKVK